MHVTQVIILLDYLNANFNKGISPQSFNNLDDWQIFTIMLHGLVEI